MRGKGEGKEKRKGRREAVSTEGQAERGTSDSSKCAEQVLQNPRSVTFRKRRVRWGARPGLELLPSGAAGSENRGADWSKSRAAEADGGGGRQG